MFNSLFLFVFLILTACATPSTRIPASAPPSDTAIYYSGQAQSKIFVTGTVLPTQKIVLKKMLLPSKNLVVEIACAPTSNGYKRSPVYMKVSGQTLSISDNEAFQTGNIDGTGAVIGDDWNWTNLFFNMKTSFEGKIGWVNDVNTVAGSKLLGMKALYFNAGSVDNPVRPSEPGMLMTVEMDKIDRAQYESQLQLLGCLPD